MSDVKFIHCRPITVVTGAIKNSGGCTVAFREVSDGIEYATAWCSPKDNFNKALGRIKAEGRLKSDQYRKHTTLNFTDFIKMHNRRYVEDYAI